MTDNKNIVLIGMPSAGKTAVGSRLAKLLGRRYEDMDGRLEERFGITIAEYFTRFGEASFRAEEKKLACELALESGLVIATGGGIVKDPDNMRCLAENGIIVWLDRSVGLLRGTPDRPLSPDDESVRRLYAQRLPLYEKYADIRICADAGPYDVAAYTAQALKGCGTAEGPFFPKLPPDKALSHRALIAAYLAGDGCRLFSVACNDDVNATKAALEKFWAAGKDGIVIDCGDPKPATVMIELIMPCTILSSAIISSMPWVTTPFAMANRTNSLTACSGFFTSAKLPQVFITPTTKNKTSRAYPMACTAPWTLCMTAQMEPPLKVSGDCVRSCQISASFPDHISSAFSMFLTIQLSDKISHLLGGRSLHPAPPSVPDNHISR